MAEARGRTEWSRTASVMALVANLHRTRNQRAFTPADFDPYAAADRHVTRTRDLSILRDAFCPSESSPTEPRQ